MKVISTVCEKEKGLIFNRILADSAKLGISIEWGSRCAIEIISKHSVEV